MAASRVFLLPLCFAVVVVDVFVAVSVGVASIKALIG